MMFAATSRSDLPATVAPYPALERGAGVAKIGFAVSGGTTRLSHLYQHAPSRVLFPRAERDEPAGAVLLTTSGGLTGGDTLSLKISTGQGARASVTSQAAEKIYRALSGTVTVDTRVEVADAAMLEYVPQETILFDRADLARRTEFILAPTSTMIAGNLLMLGRAAHGETFDAGRLVDHWRIRRGGRLIWADGLRIDGDAAAMREDKARLAGAAALGSLIIAHPDPAALATYLDLARQALGRSRGSSLRGAASLVNGVLVVRLLGQDGQAMRDGFIALWLDLRAAVAGFPTRAPRVWSC